MPICIAGMHRSGTSMVARLLNLCGLYLGPEEELFGAAFDNEAGFWENARFVELNEEALSQLGGGWDWPPNLTEEWESRDEMVRLRENAAGLIDRFSCHEIWGWKDPRNSVLLPFWRRLIPDVKVVICLRNPLEVAHSLLQRGHSSRAFSLNLWLTYNERLLSSTLPAERVITHYDAYFYDPRAELQRILSLLKISTCEEVIEQACSTISRPLRHSWVTTEELIEMKIPLEVMDCYMRMCIEAGAIYAGSAEQLKLLAESKSETGG